MKYIVLILFLLCPGMLLAQGSGGMPSPQEIENSTRVFSGKQDASVLVEFDPGDFIYPSGSAAHYVFHKVMRDILPKFCREDFFKGKMSADCAHAMGASLLTQADLPHYDEKRAQAETTRRSLAQIRRVSYGLIDKAVRARAEAERIKGGAHAH